MPPTLPADPHAPPPADLRLSRRELVLIAAFWTLFALLTVANRLVGAGESDPFAATATGPIIVAFAESLCWALVTPAVFWLASQSDAEERGAVRLRAVRLRAVRLRAVRISRGVRIALVVALGALAAGGITLLGNELRGAFGPFGPGGPGDRAERRADARVPITPRAAADRDASGGREEPGPRRRGGPRPRRRPPWFAFANAVLTYVGVYAAGLARAYSLRYRARNEQAVRLHAQLADARLEALRRQLDPHFLFNTLNAVSALVERDPRGVRRMIARLSDLLRHSFEGPDEPEVPLRDELALLGRYVDIMQVRFQGRLAVETHAEPRVLDALVPSMILQPLVENAIKHGVERITGPGRIDIEAATEGATLVLRVSDNGPGPTAGAASGRRDAAAGGVGLRNTVARLAQLHGDAQRFTLAARDGGGAVAEVRLPFRTRATTAASGAAVGGAGG
jgi:signal transduction histidine kinase